jgi:hypothetical protein
MLGKGGEHGQGACGLPTCGRERREIETMLRHHLPRLI